MQLFTSDGPNATGMDWRGDRLRMAPAGPEGAAMARQYVDCREFPSETNCSVAIAADNKEELIEAAVQHAVAVHGHQDTPELRQQVAAIIKMGTPPVEAPAKQAA
jgi:predicted small metal-binding protein